MTEDTQRDMPQEVPTGPPATPPPPPPPPPLEPMPPYPQPSGGIPAWAIVLIVVGGLVVVLGMAAGFMLPALWKAQEAARRTSCMSNVRQIGLAMQQYSTEWDGRFPPLVDSQGSEVRAVDPDSGRINTTDPARSAFALLLHKGYLTTTKVFVCPSSDDRVADAEQGFPTDFKDAELQELILNEDQCSYGWDPTKSSNANACTALIADKPSDDVSARNEGTEDNNSDNHRKEGQNVWYVDGHVKWATTSQPEAGDDPDIYLGDAGYERSHTDAKIIR